MTQIGRYKWVLLFLLADCVVFLWNPVLGLQIAVQTRNGFLEMLSFIPPIFIILGLLDTWVPRQTVIQHLGPGSGIKGLILTVTLGAAAAGPLYGAFPVAAVMMKKGVSFFNVMVFISAWATLKIPMLFFETQYLGALFSFTRWVCSLVGILLISYTINRLIPEAEKKAIFTKCQM